MSHTPQDAPASRSTYLQPLIDQILPLADAAGARKRIDERTAMGKLVLVP